MGLDYVSIMRYVTGIFTAGAVLFFFAPQWAFDKILDIPLKDEVTIFIVRHWGLLIGIVGLLIICSVHNPAIRPTILIAAVIEKTVIVWMILKNIKKEFTKGLRGILVFDTICVVLYLLYLAGIT